MNNLTENETKIVTTLGDAWNLFLQQEPKPIGDDLTDFRKAIHDAQRIVYTQAFIDR